MAVGVSTACKADRDGVSHVMDSAVIKRLAKLLATFAKTEQSRVEAPVYK